MKNAFFEKLFLVALRFFMLIWLLIYPQMSDAQIKNIRFKHITVDDGLSNSWVHSILQDKYGFIWFGTDAGLDRYDGYSFREYKNDFRDKNSISNSCILSIFEDSRGKFWIGSREGLNLYDRKNNRFIKNVIVQQQPAWSLAEDKDKNLWIGSTTNFWRYNIENDSVHTYTLPQRSIIARTIFVDSRNNVWIGTYYGLLLYDKKKDSFVYYYHDDNDSSSLGNNNIFSILEDKAGRLWIGTQAGLELYTNSQHLSQKGIFEHYQNNSKDESSIAKGTIFSLLEDDKHNLWIGTENGGLDMINLTNFQNRVNTFIHFKNDPSLGTSLSNNSIYSLCKDEQGNIWIGTYGDGINRINLLK